jgi:hypothetical protein
MRSNYYTGVCTKPGTYYQGWFMPMRSLSLSLLGNPFSQEAGQNGGSKNTQGQMEEFLLSRSSVQNNGRSSVIFCAVCRHFVRTNSVVLCSKNTEFLLSS